MYGMLIYVSLITVSLFLTIRNHFVTVLKTGHDLVNTKMLIMYSSN